MRNYEKCFGRTITETNKSRGVVWPKSKVEPVNVPN